MEIPPSPLIHVRVIQLMYELITIEKHQRDEVINKAGIPIHRGRNIWRAKKYYMENPTSTLRPEGATRADESDLIALLTAFPAKQNKYALPLKLILKPNYYPVRIENGHILHIATHDAVRTWQVLHFLTQHCGVPFAFLEKQLPLPDTTWSALYYFAYEHQADAIRPTLAHLSVLLGHYFFLKALFEHPPARKVEQLQSTMAKLIRLLQELQT